MSDAGSEALLQDARCPSNVPHHVPRSSMATFRPAWPGVGGARPTEAGADDDHIVVVRTAHVSHPDGYRESDTSTTSPR